MTDNSDYKDITKLIHAGSKKNVSEPLGITIPLSSSWLVPENGDGGVDHDYGRVGNELYSRLESQVSVLEGAKFCTVYSSGIAALNAVFSMLGENKKIFLEQNLYGCTIRLLKIFERFGLTTEYIDFTDPENYERIIDDKPDMVLIESPTNPMLKILDIEEIAKFTKKSGSLLVLDNSFSGSFSQQPLSFGVDISVVSLTKHANGHSTGMIGAACTNDKDLAEKLFFNRKACGLQPGVIETATTIQGIQTIGLRCQKSANSALEVAKYLQEHPKVKGVNYPGLYSGKQYSLAKKQMRTFSSVLMVDFEFDIEQTVKFVENLKPLFARSHSIGSSKSQVSMPARMSHADVPKEQRLKSGITDGLVRLSIGLEESEDLIKILDFSIKSVT